ncbi:MAG: cytidine deaminase [Prevotella sp.]|nr:cytidine deaminase [Prevotella sp.]
MEAKNINTTIYVANMEELDEKDRQLVEAAIEATKSSYAPYSHFNVGAAVRLDNGVVIPGCNQENAAFGVTICAERTALFAAGAQYPDAKVEAIAIAARNADGLLDEPIPPCGTCRQAMVETEKRSGNKLHILLYGRKHVYIIEGIGALLPLTFSDEQL